MSSTTDSTTSYKGSFRTSQYNVTTNSISLYQDGRRGPSSRLNKMKEDSETFRTKLVKLPEKTTGQRTTLQSLLRRKDNPNFKAESHLLFREGTLRKRLLKEHYSSARNACFIPSACGDGDQRTAIGYRAAGGCGRRRVHDRRQTDGSTQTHEYMPL